MKISYNYKSLFLKIFFLILLCTSFLFSDLAIVVDSFPASSLSQGDISTTVVNFKIGGSGKFTKIDIGNSAGTVPFKDSGISKIEVFQGSSTTSLGSKDFILSTEYTLWTISFPAIDITSTINFRIAYTVASNSLSGSTVLTNISIPKIYDEVNGTEAVPALAISKDIPILSAGLTASGFANLVDQSNSNACPGLMNMPFYQFVLRAETVTINLQTIKISAANAGDRLFATSPANKEGRIKGVMLLLGSAGNDFGGIGVDTLLAYYVLPTSNPNSNFVEFTIPGGLIINKYNESHDEDKYFYVLYDIGNGFPVGGTISCALMGGTGINVSSGGSVSILGSFPVGAVTTTFKSVNSTIRSSSVNPSANHTMVIAGQKNVRMIYFTLDNIAPISNASIIIKNSSGTFSPNRDEGVSKVSLYKKSSPNDLLIASTETFTDVNTCYLPNITMPSGTKQMYYVEYDFGIGATNNEAQCQLGGITSGNIILGGYVPAPAQGAFVNTSPARVWVEFVTANIREITAKGTSFRVDIGVRNIITEVGQPSIRVFLDPTMCLPKFYSSDIGFGTDKISGRDLSTEYSYDLMDTFNATPNGDAYDNPFNDGLFPFVNRIVTLSYIVSANNLASNGYVYVDAQLGYNNGENDSDPQKVIFQKYFISGTLYPAARKFNEKTDNFYIINVSGISASTAPLPSYIKSVNTRKNSSLSWKRFVNMDMIEPQVIMLIQLDPAQIFDTMTLYNNGVFLNPGIDYIFDSANNNITILNIGRISGKLSFSGAASGILQSTDIEYKIAGGSKSLSDLFAGPSPFNPDSGPLSIGFNADADCECTIYIYNISGQEMLKETIQATTGYNNYSYDPVYKSGRVLGRGVYLVRVITDGGKSEVRTKFGVK